MPVWVLPIGRVLHGGFGEGQASDYAAGIIMPARLLQVWGLLFAEPLIPMLQLKTSSIL